MAKNFFGFEDGRLLKPSVRNFSFAWLADNPLNFSEVGFEFKLTGFRGWNDEKRYISVCFSTY